MWTNSWEEPNPCLVINNSHICWSMKYVGNIIPMESIMQFVLQHYNYCSIL